MKLLEMASCLSFRMTIAPQHHSYLATLIKHCCTDALKSFYLVLGMETFLTLFETIGLGTRRQVLWIKMGKRVSDLKTALGPN